MKTVSAIDFQTWIFKTVHSFIQFLIFTVIAWFLKPDFIFLQLPSSFIKIFGADQFHPLKFTKMYAKININNTSLIAKFKWQRQNLNSMQFYYCF